MIIYGLAASFTCAFAALSSAWFPLFWSTPPLLSQNKYLLVSSYPTIHGNAHCCNIRQIEPMLSQALLGKTNSIEITHSSVVFSTGPIKPASHKDTYFLQYLLIMKDTCEYTKKFCEKLEFFSWWDKNNPLLILTLNPPHHLPPPIKSHSIAIIYNHTRELVSILNTLSSNMCSLQSIIDWLVK